MSKTLLLAALLSIGYAPAQQAGLTAPVQGYIFDAPSRSIRTVTGFLGSASLGSPILSQVDFGSVAPGQNYALIVRRGEIMQVSGLGTAQLSATTLQLAASMPDGVVWSSDGSAAVLYSQSGNWIQIFTGFPGTGTAGTQLSLPMAGKLSAVCVDANAQHVVVGVTGNGSGVYQIGADQSFSLLLQASAPVSLSISGDGSALYALDQATNQIFQLSWSNLGVQAWPAGVSDAIAIHAAVDRTGENVLYVAGRTSRSLVSINRGTQTVIATATLSFTPTMIEPLGSNGFALTRRAFPSDILWTFTNTSQPGIYFVPAPTIPTPRREVSGQ